MLVYSSFEENVLRDLAADFPDLAPELQIVIGRLFDLLPLVRETVYTTEFRGSFSIKRVAPALDPGFSYEGLDAVSNGAAAARAIEDLLSGELAPSATDHLRQSLRAYCKRDTEALLSLHRALRARAAAT